MDEKKWIICFDKILEPGIEIINGSVVAGALVDVMRKFVEISKIRSEVKLGDYWYTDILYEECDIYFGYNLLRTVPYFLKNSFPFYQINGLIISRCGMMEKAFEIEVNSRIILGIILSLLSFAVISCFSEKENTSREGIMRTFFKYFWIYFAFKWLVPTSSGKSKASSILLATWSLSLVVFLATVGGTMKAKILVSKDNNYDSVRDVLAAPKIHTFQPGYATAAIKERMIFY